MVLSQRFPEFGNLAFFSVSDTFYKREKKTRWLYALARQNLHCLPFQDILQLERQPPVATYELNIYS
ncbi:hypothetical protein MarSH_060 [Marseillevirus Shanghai 1]|nr:hypothetical protein MarSH_060 [Marseillevirus Shanghai 1]